MGVLLDQIKNPAISASLKYRVSKPAFIDIELSTNEKNRSDIITTARENSAV